jgi:hypothetical protein
MAGKHIFIADIIYNLQSLDLAVRCSSRISSAMLVRESRTSSANGAFGRHDRHDNAGMRLDTAAS